MALPSITLVGNLTADPELRFTNSGKGVVNLRVACNERKKDDQGNWIDGDTTYLDVTSWRAAEQISSELRKGQRVIITGILRQRDYETATGEKRKAFEVLADGVAPLITESRNSTPATQAPANDPWADAGIPATEITDNSPF